MAFLICLTNKNDYSEKLREVINGKRYITSGWLPQSSSIWLSRNPANLTASHISYLASLHLSDTSLEMIPPSFASTIKEAVLGLMIRRSVRPEGDINSRPEHLSFWERPAGGPPEASQCPRHRGDDGLNRSLFVLSLDDAEDRRLRWLRARQLLFKYLINT